MRKHGRKQLAGPFSSPVLTLVAAAAVVLAGLGLLAVLPGGSDSNSPVTPVATTDAGAALPEYVMAAPAKVQTAYRFVVERADVMVWIPCYCGCGEHSGHLSARNCFVKEGSTASRVEFDSHGAGCDMCVGIALDTKAMIEEGRSLRDIRAYIDSQYGSMGPGTDTPLPPG